MAFLGGQIYLQGRPAREGDSSTLLAVGPGRRSRCFSAVGKIGPTEAVRPDTRSARGELTESPRSCPTRLCRTEGSAQHSVKTPARTARPSEPLVRLRPPQAGPSSTALDGVCVDASTPPGNTFCTKGSSGTCSACKGHRPCIKAGATKRVLLAPGILSALLHQKGSAQRLQRGTSSRQA